MQLYELIQKVSDILTPETNAFYTYVLHTSDDDGGFLRTRYCWWDKCVKDRVLDDDDYKKVLVASGRPIDINHLTRHDTKYVKLQFEYRYTDPSAEDAVVDVILGYPYIYIFDLKNGTYSMEYKELPY